MAYVHQIKGLRVYQILEDVRKHTDIDLLMPDLSGDKLPNRDYVINVGKIVSKLKSSIVNTLAPECLREMVDGALEAREEKYTEKRNIKMNVLPEFRRMFDSTKEISSKWLITNWCRENGRFYQLIRSAKVRRQNRANR